MNSELVNDYSSESKARLSLNSSVSSKKPKKLEIKNLNQYLPIKEVNPSNFNTLKSNQDFEKLEKQINGSEDPKKIEISEKNKIENEELPTQLRVSRTEFEPSERSRFNSTKINIKESQMVDQKETLGRYIINI